MPKLRRMLVTLTVAMLALIGTMTATAKKPDKPPLPTTQFYEVTMEFAGNSEGFSTTAGACGADVLSRLVSTDGGRNLSAFDGDGGHLPLIELWLGRPDTADPLDWYRDYPYYQDPAAALTDGFDPADYPYDPRLEGDRLEGCHGAGLDVYVEYDADGNKVLAAGMEIMQYPGLFHLSPADGEVQMLWHSDYYREWERVNRKKWKCEVIENFTLSSSPNETGALAWTDPDTGDPVIWDPAVGASGLVSGWVRISHFSRDTIFQEFPGSPRSVEFMLTLTPAS